MNKTLKLNIKYALLNGAYWGEFAIFYAYAIFFLRSRGFDPGDVGAIIAFSGFLSIFVQLKYGELCDHSKTWTWRKILLICSSIILILTISLKFIHIKILVSLIYGIILICISSTMGLVNAAGFYYESFGKSPDFGIGRAAGSLMFAIVSLLLGKLTEKFSADGVTIMGIADSLLFIIISYLMPYYGKAKKAEKKESISSKKHGSFKNFAIKYPYFILMCIGLVSLLIFHNMNNTYLINILENVGGNSENLGFALAIAAFLEIPVMCCFSYLVKRYGSEKLLCVAALSYFIKGIIIIYSSSVLGIYFSQILQISSFTLFTGASVYYTESSVLSDDKMKAHAIMSNVTTAGMLLGNMLGGFLIDHRGTIFMMYIATATVLIGTCPIFLSAYKTSKKR